MNTIYIGAALIIIGILMLLRATGIFEAIDREVLWAAGIIAVGGLLIMQRQK